jgi:hypothetical protein
MSAENKSDLKTYNIHLWENYNTLDSDEYFCESKLKSGKVCNKKCSYKWKKDNEWCYCCKTHFPKTITIQKINHFKKKLIKDYLLQDIAKIVLTKIQEIYNLHVSIFKQVTCLIIELQPKINQKMKFTSHIIYGKFVELYNNTNTIIRFVRASHKLKAYNGPMIECTTTKNPYAKRKWLAVQYIQWFLENDFSIEVKNKWLPFFESKMVKADMSDTCLMAINQLHGIPKKQKMNFKKNNIV